MSVDPSDPETFQEEDEDAVDFSREMPEADAAEQHTDVRRDRHDRLTRIHWDAADEADAVDQARVVELDEDEYR
ncbi:hypothetical protein [Embleya scabrispora]|uniref:hypothetical protein n=1 Tax=Embleya scabrispora TaxID=159449 RepID=UPI000477A71D|nr:hypothetical protein [Embleya scabrispora]MYS85956.1 hypothetical protein [Streptomyces sp. SID5474]